MHNLFNILSALRAAIAARAARDRVLAVVLVSMWARIARMGARLARLVAHWRAGTLPKRRVPGPRQVGRVWVRPPFPTAPSWLLRMLGHQAVGYGLQLQHGLTDAECVAFLAAVPQAGRILRPLLRMLAVDPLPELVRRRSSPARVAAAPYVEKAGVAAVPVSKISGA